MKKNKILSSILVSALLCSAAFSGCSLVSTNNKADMEQVIATVNIANSDKIEEGLKSYKDAVVASDVLKRDLIASFINVGEYYIQSGMSGTTVINMLVNSLVNTEVTTQYAVLNLLDEKVKTEGGSAASVVSAYTALETEKEKYESLLTEDEINEVKYNFYVSLNESIDTYEEQFIEKDEVGYTGTGTRTTPGNVDTETEKFYPKAEDGSLDYNVYTGYNGYLLAGSGDYAKDALEGTSKATRIKAYNQFVNSLNSNFLVDPDTENLSDILSLNYVKDQYVLQLKSAVTNKYYEVYEKQLKEKILSDDDSYIQTRYDALFKQQEASYTTSSAFETAMGSMNDSSFILYSPSTEDDSIADENGVYNTYGFVYNILLPFDTLQNQTLSALQNERTTVADGKVSENKYFADRNALLKNIKTYDQRAAWFNGSTEYAFDAADTVADYYGKDDNRNYLFFENNLTNNNRYESLKNYDGRYSFNGKAVKNTNGSYSLIYNKIDIDGMLEEFESYVEYVLEDETAVTINKNNSYYNTTDFYKEGSEKEVDYSKLVYADGKVDIGTFNNLTLFDKTTDQYKAMSAVNELQYAYTTDTGVLSQYVGYNVSAYTTQYIKEFEYATQQAIKNGAGSFAVCAGDYGWHLIYVTYTFDSIGGEVYSNPDWSKIEEEGTFENLFFEYVKTSDLSTAESGLRMTLIQTYTGEDSVTHYEDRYQDLVDLYTE